jgi:GNAT superfamily N-acetyltransferase
VWGYTDEFLEKCRDELTYDIKYIASNLVYVAEERHDIVGFYSLEHISNSDIELGAIFVKPEDVRQGVGKALIEHAIEQARKRGHEKMIIQGDPNAESFYLSFGAIRIGEKESMSIKGRMLPLYVIVLADAGLA